MTGTVLLQYNQEASWILPQFWRIANNHICHTRFRHFENFYQDSTQPQSLKVVNNILGKSLMNSNFTNPKFSWSPGESFKNYSKFLVTCYQITSVIFYEMKTWPTKI